MEEIVEWFFDKYVSTEFGIENFEISMPSEGSTYRKKCASISPAMETALKKFALFVNNGQIDLELLNFRSNHMFYENIASLLTKKYVYGIGQDFDFITYLFFSDQSRINYFVPKKKSYDSFYELLVNESPSLDDFEVYQKGHLNELIVAEYLRINHNGRLELCNPMKIRVLKDLYTNEVISYWHCPNEYRDTIDDMFEENLIEFEQKLFSRPEQAYFNYFLNMSQFNNGLDLRNRYGHIQGDVDANAPMHSTNYLILLRIFILIVIKINDDLCLYFENNFNQNKVKETM